MKVNESFISDRKLSNIEYEFSFHEAIEQDIDGIIQLMIQRNPLSDPDQLLLSTKNEIMMSRDNIDYGLFVAKFQNKIVGFCRFYHSKCVNKEKILFDSPEGYYVMGTIVSKVYRRRGVAHFLSKKRELWLKDLGVKEIYSCVSLQNKVSHQMHKTFGYQKLHQIKGFLHVDFDGERGELYRKKIE